MPTLIHLESAAKQPPNTINIYSTRWGNPYHIGPDGLREEVILKYKDWVLAQLQQDKLRLDELHGKDLVCWCAPQPCHGDVLLALANPHATVTRHGPRVWRCIDCKMVARYEVLRVFPCTKVFPPCSRCGRTPQCARDCSGMAEILGNPHVIAAAPPAQCELCGKVSELRPYGPNNENICYNCGMKNLEVTNAKIGARFE